MPRSSLCLAVLALAGCAATGDVAGMADGLMPARLVSLVDATQPAVVATGVAMPPIVAPSRSEFFDRTVENRLSGGSETLRMHASGRRIRIESAAGCRSTRLLDWFSPSVAWEGCGGSDDWRAGRAKVGVRDPLYPLEVGATGRYRRWATSHTGETSVRTTDCRVADAVTLDLGGRRADAFVVACDDGRIERTTWYAPGEGPVAYREAHKRRGLREAWVVAR